MLDAYTLKALDILDNEAEFMEIHKHDVSKIIFESVAEKVCRNMNNLFIEISKKKSDEQQIKEIIDHIHKLNLLLCGER